MRNSLTTSINGSEAQRRSAGFSLIELMVAMAVSLVIGGAAMQLFRTHVPLFTQQQNQAALNFTLRNAAAQMQIDVVNAGDGFYPAADVAASPVGITILNNYVGSGSTCYDQTTNTYGPNCFDELNVVTADTTVPLAHPTDNGANCVSTTSSNIFATPLTGTLDNLASYFKAGDQVLLVTKDLQHYTTTTLTKDAQVTGGKVKLQHNPTGAGGTNTADNDPFFLSTGASNNQLGETFCEDDWILKLSATGSVTYRVDASDPSDPKLIRELKLLNTREVVAEQIIGFKVGASVESGDADFRYKADNAETDDPKGYNSEWSLIKAVRITIIGRTPPLAGSSTYVNDFDHGPYKVEAVSVVVNPRNLSMNE